MKEMINGLKRVILAGIQPTLNFFNGDRHTQRAVILAAWLLIFLLVLPVNVKSAIVKGVKSQDNSIFLLLLFTNLSLSLL